MTTLEAEAESVPLTLEQFVADRDAQLLSIAELLTPAIVGALTEDADTMEALLVEALGEAFDGIYEGFNGPPELMAAARQAFIEDMVPSIEMLNPDGTDAQVARLAAWFATAALGAATISANPGTTKTWITMLDDSVRETHGVVHSRTVAAGETFNIGGHALLYPGQPIGPPEIWINCRCVLSVDATIVAAAELAQDEDDPEAPDDLVEEDALATKEIAVSGVMIVEDTSSGDGRRFLPGSLTFRELPLPISWQRMSADGHARSIVVGRIDELERVGKLIEFGGVVIDTPDTDDLIGLIEERALRGISADVDSIELEVSDDPDDLLGQIMGQSETVFAAGRVAGGTIVPIPAFQEAFIQLGPRDRGQDEEVPAVEPDAADTELVAAARQDFKRGAGWITNPKATRRIHSYWTRGKGATKIAWGQGGDFRRCRLHLAKYVSKRFLNRTCAQWHFDALGYWPAERDKHTSSIEGGQSMSLVAAATNVYQLKDFGNPNLPGPTPFTVRGETVFGHLAAWGVCHIGVDKLCVEAPHSVSNYAHFHTGETDTEEGPLAVGVLTMDTGHAGRTLRAAAAVAHYDDTGTQVAKIRCGEDAHGIWMAGVLCPNVTSDQVDRLRAGAISGDWRGIGGNLELVAGLAVNTPGFPIPRVGLAASGTKLTALVAAGVVPNEDISELTDAVVDELERRSDRAAKMSVVHDHIRATRLDRLLDR